MLRILRAASCARPFVALAQARRKLTSSMRVNATSTDVSVAARISPARRTHFSRVFSRGHAWGARCDVTRQLHVAGTCEINDVAQLDVINRGIIMVSR